MTYPARRVSTLPLSGVTVSRDPREATFFQDPYAFDAERHAEGTAFYWADFGHWCFVGWGEVNALLRDRRFGRQILHVASRAEVGLAEPKAHLKDFDGVEAHSLLELEPPEHTKLRSLVTRAFVSRHVERLRPVVEAFAHQLIDGFAGKGEVELIEAFAMPVPVTIIADMLGVPREMTGKLLDWSHTMVRMYMFSHSEADELAANRVAAEFRDYLKSLVAERRRAPREDLISHMITAEQDGGKLTEDELISTTILLLNAGHEATVHQTGNAVKTILHSGLDPKALFANPEAAAATVEECLRFDPPLHMFTRWALSDLTLEGGIVLKKGDEIGLMLAAANRDPQRFPDPGRFDPARADNANVSFGAGIHFCIGAPLARIELQVALKVLFDRLPGLRLAGAPHYRDSYHFHGLDRLDLAW
ncbi:MAG: cytochrome P450 [Cucumibacter sp.]